MSISITALFEYVFLVIAGLLPIANPFSTAPMFIALTAEMAPADRNAQANRACVYMAGILLGAFFLGSVILDFFSITIPAIRLAGGLVIFYIGFGMLYSREKAIPEEIAVDGTTHTDYAFTPLAMPMLSGPGSIAVVLGMSAKVAEIKPLLNQILGVVVVTVGILITAFVCWLVLRAARGIVKRMGATRIDLITKMLGFLLMCIGVQFAADGVIGFANG